MGVIMEYIEISAKTVEDALTEASVKLGTTSDKIEYEVKGNPKVSILIPNKDHIELLKQCINSILKLTTYDNYEIVIIENNSEKEETFKYYTEISKNDKVRVIDYTKTLKKNEPREFNYSKIINFGVK